MDSWITDYEEKEKKYNSFYNKDIKSIKLKIYFIENDEIIRVCKDKIDISNNILKKDQLIKYFFKYKTFESTSYKLVHLLSYIVDLDENDVKNYILNEDVNHFFKKYTELHDINISKSIDFFHNINEIIFVLKQKDTINALTQTKKIKLNIFNKFTKNKKTRRK